MIVRYPKPYKTNNENLNYANYADMYECIGTHRQA